MSNLISRQDAIHAVIEWYGCEPKDIGVFEKIVEKISSEQPEIIRCKDCKHWDGVDTCDVIDAPVWDNDFCSMAERRSDE